MGMPALKAFKYMLDMVSANIKKEISTHEDINIGRGNKHDYVYPLLSGVLTTCSFFSFYKWVNKGCKKV